VMYDKQFGMMLTMDNGHVMRILFKNIPNNWLIWADGPNKNCGVRFRFSFFGRRGLVHVPEPGNCFPYDRTLLAVVIRLYVSCSPLN
jgi:hypothetical protein